MPRHKTGIIKAGTPQPFAQIGANRGNAIEPDALDGRGKVVVVPRGDIGNDGIELLVNSIQVAGPYRKQSFSSQPREKLELDVMDQRTALQWIELVNWLRLEARCEAEDCIEKEPVGAARIRLEGCWRIAASAE